VVILLWWMVLPCRSVTVRLNKF